MHADLPWTNSAFCGMCRSMLGQLQLAASAKDQGEPGCKGQCPMPCICAAKLNRCKLVMQTGSSSWVVGHMVAFSTTP